MTHAFFKALLFLAAGSVIIAMHHEQDIRKMGGLRKYMPITYWTALIGSLALIGFPGRAGSSRRTALIEAVHESHWHGQARRLLDCLPERAARRVRHRAVFVPHVLPGIPWRGAHGQGKRSHLHETPWVVTGAADHCLAIPSAIIGWFTIGPVLFGGFFGDAICRRPEATTCWANRPKPSTAALGFVTHAHAGPGGLPGSVRCTSAWFLYLKRPGNSGSPAAKDSRRSTNLLDRKYYFDDLYIKGFAAGGRAIGRFLWHTGDEVLIDGTMVNGSANAVGRLAGVMRQLQTGYLYHYAFAMIIGLTALLGWLLWRS